MAKLAVTVEAPTTLAALRCGLLNVDHVDALASAYANPRCGRLLGDFVEAFVSAADVLSLVEQVTRQVDRDEAEKLARKVASGKDFNLEDLLGQLRQIEQKLLTLRTHRLDHVLLIRGNSDGSQNGDNHHGDHQLDQSKAR